MVMEFQGKKATHDFLSLYNKDSTFQLQDSRPPSHGFYLQTHDFLKPLEKTDSPEPAHQQGPTAVAHVLPGGIGTYSISHVAGSNSPTDVKPEVGTCVSGSGCGSKPEPVNGAYASYAGVAFALWDASSAAAKDVGSGGQWPSSFAARPTASFTSRNHSTQDNKRVMEVGSRSSRGFDEEDEGDEEFGKREGTSKKVVLNVTADRKFGNDQKPTTPRSKHSATEQRRRSKINDRFQILRDLIPHSDQKRDKASFLLEVIEYIRFLQEKVQKYESTYPDWSEENTKLTPWNNNNVSSNAAAADDDPSQLIKIGHASCNIYSVENKSNHIEVDSENPIGFSRKATSAPVSLQPKNISIERGGACATQTQQRSVSDIDNMASQSHSHWLRPSSCPNDYSVSSDTLNEQEELTIDEGTISVSTAYSRNILNTLIKALEGSGIDMSQANISVQINLGKRPTKRGTAETMSSVKGPEEFTQAPKRHRSDNN